MKDTLHYIITAIVDSPDAVIIDEQTVDGVDTFSVTVAKDDMGKIIGKEGKVIRSIRNVMKIAAMKQDKRITINLVEQSQE